MSETTPEQARKILEDSEFTPEQARKIIADAARARATEKERQRRVMECQKEIQPLLDQINEIAQGYKLALISRPLYAPDGRTITETVLVNAA